jgi:hypothetical protein
MDEAGERAKEFIGTHPPMRPGERIILDEVRSSGWATYDRRVDSQVR